MSISFNFNFFIYYNITNYTLLLRIIELLKITNLLKRKYQLYIIKLHLIIYLRTTIKIFFFLSI